MYQDSFQEKLKNLCDKVFGAAFLLMSLPLLAVAAVLVKLTSPGPVIFRQIRHGLRGEEILVYKLRTMCDGKVTAVGRVLRATSIDELPQLYNVLRGDMSLVGPRPHPVELNNRYASAIGDFQLRHSIKPGMTGLAQISGARGPIRCSGDMRRRVAYDVKYIREWSLGMDARIVARTILGGVISRQANSPAEQYDAEVTS